MNLNVTLINYRSTYTFDLLLTIFGFVICIIQILQKEKQ